MSIEQLLGYFGYAAGAAGALVYFRGSSAKNTIDVLESNNKALVEQNEILKSANLALTAELHTLQGKVQVLTDMVTGGSAIKALSEQIAAAVQESQADHSKMVELLNAMLESLQARKTRKTATH